MGGGLKEQRLKVVGKHRDDAQRDCLHLVLVLPDRATGPLPTWYKSESYRARVVREPRVVLSEFGLDLDPAIRSRCGTRVPRPATWCCHAARPRLQAPSQQSLADRVTRNGMRCGRRRRTVAHPACHSSSREHQCRDAPACHRAGNPTCVPDGHDRVRARLLASDEFDASGSDAEDFVGAVSARVWCRGQRRAPFVDAGVAAVLARRSRWAPSHSQAGRSHPRPRTGPFVGRSSRRVVSRSGTGRGVPGSRTLHRHPRTAGMIPAWQASRRAPRGRRSAGQCRGWRPEATEEGVEVHGRR